MAKIYLNVESLIIYFVDSSQLTNWNLDSGVTCRMTPEISDFVLGSMVEMNKCIEVADAHFIIAKKNSGGSK